MKPEMLNKFIAQMKINFCPMCGRNLRRVNERT